jgi:dienelactone hydrolase
MPLLLLLHGIKDDGKHIVEQFKQLAEKHKIVLLASDSKSERWQPPRKGKPTDDMNHAKKAFAWIKQQMRKVYSQRNGAFGHSCSARMSSTFETNVPDITKTAISHGRFVEDALGSSKPQFWMSGSPKDNMFQFSVMQKHEKWYNKTFRKDWGGAKLHK